MHRNTDLDLKTDWYRALKRKSPCIVCSEDDPNVIELHHKHPEEKLDTVLRLVKSIKPFGVIKAETEKCVPVCSNCHKKVHYGSIDLRFLYESGKRDVLVVSFNRSAKSDMELVVHRDIDRLELPPAILTAFLRNTSQLELF